MSQQRLIRDVLSGTSYLGRIIKLNGVDGGRTPALRAKLKLHRQGAKAAKEQNSLTAKDTKDAEEQPKLYREGNDNKINDQT